MILADVMQALADRLDTISGLRVYAFVPDSVQPPAAIVAYPETYTYDETMRRGLDRMTIPVYVLVGKVSDRKSRDTLGAYLDGSGSGSFKTVLESGTYSAFATLRVMDVDIAPMTFAGTEYLGAIVLVDVAG